MKVLVTGAAGFIGSHTAEKLQKAGMEVMGIDNFSPYYDITLKRQNADILKDLGVEIVEVDLRDKERLLQIPINFDFIIHFAAHPGLSAKSTFDDYYTNNVLGTRNLINFAELNKDLKHFIYISTSSVYGLKVDFPETTPPNPASDYGSTKLEGEELIMKEVELGSMKASILRLFSVYGPRERPDKLYTRLISCGLNNEVFRIFEGSEKHSRSFTYVGDIVKGIYQAVLRYDKINGEIINLGAREEYKTLDGIALVEELLGKQIKIEVISKRNGDQLATSANIGKAIEWLEYNPSTTLKEGLKKQIDWYKNLRV
ncbi:NAD-dependent epimerase/dehydratase family protein [Salinimicrobium xinjiangense]|uniref:NAD-dependent epimerase/dehydratase family protein n=1 Tax=Salinimicrobium xinjiangense TaxID=438596 RepID=UPI000429FAAC|nr:NAD-dependent epimerase/dehydratase family protein [Salinimicrobium xinjiangense]